MFFTLAGLAGAALYFIEKRKEKFHSVFMLTLCVLGVKLAIVVIAVFGGPILISPRYSLWMFFIYLLVLGFSLEALKSDVGRVLVSILGEAIFFYVGWLRPHYTEDWRAAVQTADAWAGENDKAFIAVHPVLVETKDSKWTADSHNLGYAGSPVVVYGMTPDVIMPY